MKLFVPIFGLVVTSIFNTSSCPWPCLPGSAGHEHVNFSVVVNSISNMFGSRHVGQGRQGE
jgi:hypothetical protein